MSPLVSIIIPCRNGAAWPGEAIDSCFGQTWQNLSIIVVDNGSADRSLDMARRCESRSFAVLECLRQQASAARNVRLPPRSGDN
jgi:glycosyltransferase involved in cell wall biosynthesis